jgi:hypothetical protein
MESKRNIETSNNGPLMPKASQLTTELSEIYNFIVYNVMFPSVKTNNMIILKFSKWRAKM